MSGVGFWELILVFLIGLIVLGPERLPRVAHQLGTWLGQARRMTRVMKRQLEEELNLERELNIRPRATPLPRSPAPPPPPRDDDRRSRAPAPGDGSSASASERREAGDSTAAGEQEDAQAAERRAEDRVS